MKSFEVFNFMDYESTGTNPWHDQVVQAAIIQTDKDLNILPDGQHNILVKVRPDVIPNPIAFLVTKIDVNELFSKGISEFELAHKMQSIFKGKGLSATTGYNSLNFDDVLTRSLLFRNMLDPYEHEWAKGNGRIDIFKLVQLTYAFYPEILNFPRNDLGKISLKLEDLSKANGITHLNAHDAMSDVIATIEIAKKIKEVRGSLWQHFLNLSSKRDVENVVMNSIESQTPIYFTSAFIDREKHSTTIIQPIARDTVNKNVVYCVDLSEDPTDLLKMTPEEISENQFKKSKDLPEGETVNRLVKIELNKSPLVTNTNGVFSPELLNRFQLDLAKVRLNHAKVMALPNFGDSVLNAMKQDSKPAFDPYESLYSGGFITNDDKALRLALTHDPENGNVLKSTNVYEYAGQADDPERQATLMLRAKYNSFHTEILKGNELSALEVTEWLDYLQKRQLGQCSEKYQFGINEYRDEYNAIFAEDSPWELTDKDRDILRKLNNHVEANHDYVSYLSQKHKPLKSKAQNMVLNDAEKKAFNKTTKNDGLGPSI
ncbi:exodeoxyribonuclease I [Vibrio splendidus]